MNMNIDIEPDEAFRILCKTLNMEFVLNEDIDFYLAEDKHGNICVCTQGDIYDDRGCLFVALRNLAVTMFPNLSFRNASYIFDK